MTRARLLVVLGCACSSPGGGSGTPDAAPLAGLAAPAPPLLTPCPPGWREVEGGDVVTCDPWPAGGPLDCAVDEAHFPGEPGCARVGAPCPAGEWADGLPTDRPILYVRAGGVTGGDGSMTAPFGTIAEAMAVAPSPSVVALSKGAFDEIVQLAGGVTLWGACVAQTIVTSAIPADDSGVVTIAGVATGIRNLRITGERPGVWALGAGRAVALEGVVVHDAAHFGIVVVGAQLSGQGVVVRDTRGLPGSGHLGRGLDVELGGVAELRRCAFERNHTTGVFAGTVGSALVLADVVVRDTQAEPTSGIDGIGLQVILGATATAQRCAFERNRSYGVFAAQDGASIALADVVVRDTAEQASDLEKGRGVEAQRAARVELSRTLVEGNREVAVFVDGAGTSALLADVVVRHTRAAANDDRGGRGMQVTMGAAVETTRALFADNADDGVFVDHAPTTLRLVDTVVRDTREQAADGRYGRGLAIQGGHVEVERARFERNRDLGVYVDGAGVTLELTDVVITDTRAQACEATSSCGWQVTSALGVFDGAAATVRRFRVARSALCGVQLAFGATLDLHEGEVAENPIGANVQTEGFDLARLQDQVVYRDNDVNLDGSTLPVPGPAPGP